MFDFHRLFALPGSHLQIGFETLILPILLRL